MTVLRYSFLTMQSAGRGGCMPLRPALFLFGAKHLRKLIYIELFIPI